MVSLPEFKDLQPLPSLFPDPSEAGLERKDPPFLLSSPSRPVLQPRFTTSYLPPPPYPWGTFHRTFFLPSLTHEGGVCPLWTDLYTGFAPVGHSRNSPP